MFSKCGFIVKTVSKLLYKLIKIKQLKHKKDKVFPLSDTYTQKNQKILKILSPSSFFYKKGHVSVPFSTPSVDVLAWGSRVSPEFKSKVNDISRDLNIDPNHLMACMAFETAETFSPSIKNGSGSGATGLIQFMPSTAEALGTSTKKLAQMSALEQLDYVKAYFMPYRNRLSSLEDVYMAILYPAAIGKPAAHVLFKQGSIAYRQNAGIDRNNAGKITLGDVSYKVRRKLEKGLHPKFLG
ncbi:transglycosylase SLT domain-containing protein [Vibrio harveyi]|uniref:transglycosylase SLT domain-containing protein n=1 Tax=Vibrio harveyi TaxID=669 RepID=UPI0005EE8711|nr:transglycosylase SLT domain-containing protein [Vibrio harveyi]EKO3811000.1 transglycosylase SLT domain-containing protein [Vibrio harveyi]MBY6236050.1 transglycosylase SLT domain-containing protein [Vibrio harveyi]